MQTENQEQTISNETLYKWAIDLADYFYIKLKQQLTLKTLPDNERSLIKNKTDIINTLSEFVKKTRDYSEFLLLIPYQLTKLRSFYEAIEFKNVESLTSLNLSPEQTDIIQSKIVRVLYGSLLECYLRASSLTLSNININDLLSRLIDVEKKALSPESYEQSIYAAKLDAYHILQFKYIQIEKSCTNESSKVKSLSIRVDNTISETEERMDKLSEKMNQLEALRDKIDNLTTEYNFVGLSSGFERIWRKKKDENNVIIAILFIMGIVMAIIPIYLYSISDNQDADISIINHIIHITPLFTVEIILLYFFRVLLHQLNNVKAVLLQVEQRLNICQFFSSYVDYAEQHKADKERFEKFESLIFSGLLMDQSQLPSTFDGLDNLSKLIGSIKNKP